MSDNLYLFANNNDGQAENNGSYRLYDMKIEGDPEGIESGVNYVDYLIGDGASYIDTGITPKNNYTIDVEFRVTEPTDSYECLFGNEELIGASYSNGGIALVIQQKKIFRVEKGNPSVYSSNYPQNSLFINGEFINKNIQFKYKFESIKDKNRPLYVLANRANSTPNYYCTNKIRICDFKIYNEKNILLIHLKPCLDTQGVPCMYDEVSKKYFYNKGTGTFGYKKTLRDFQPVLDSNNVPCLLDKINNKFYYNKGIGNFEYKNFKKYVELDCIKQDGNSWIDTGIKDTDINGGTVEIKCGSIEWGSKWVSIAVFGCGGGNNTGDAISLGLKSNYVRQFKGFNETIIANINDSTIYKGIGINTNTNKNILVGAVNGYDGGYCGSSAEGHPIYYFKIWNSDGILIQYLIPAKDNENNIGMYDKVSKQFFKNQGTGTFNYSYGILEYIESNGTQYIDTEVVPTTNTDIDMTCRACDYSDEVNISNSYIMNGLKIDSNKYNYNNTATESQPNLVASTGATLTMGSKNLAYLTDDEKEQAINNGWSLL